MVRWKMFDGESYMENKTCGPDISKDTERVYIR